MIKGYELNSLLIHTSIHTHDTIILFPHIHYFQWWLKINLYDVRPCQSSHLSTVPVKSKKVTYTTSLSMSCRLTPVSWSPNTLLASKHMHRMFIPFAHTNLHTHKTWVCYLRYHIHDAWTIHIYQLIALYNRNSHKITAGVILTKVR